MRYLNKLVRKLRREPWFLVLCTFLTPVARAVLIHWITTFIDKV